MTQKSILVKIVLAAIMLSLISVKWDALKILSFSMRF